MAARKKQRQPDDRPASVLSKQSSGSSDDDSDWAKNATNTSSPLASQAKKRAKKVSMICFSYSP